MDIYSRILLASSRHERLLAVLIDPDKFHLDTTEKFISKINNSLATHIFIGGSTVAPNATARLVESVKKHTTLPIILFPGDVTQITDKADGLLFLSLLSGRNPDYLIGKHVEAIPLLKTTSLEIIPTGYILIESGAPTTVVKVSDTKPIPRANVEHITHTACAGELLGLKLMYLEAGSGALIPVDIKTISTVKASLNIPVIVGGGIRKAEDLENAYKAGADMVVIGTAFETDESFFEAIKSDTTHE